ncbi:MAG: type III pantothenate kinase [Clostridia bacterium]|nr:type III pantothenate kinase [Clostridia bacterium]
MILTVDIGNSAITIGGFVGDELRFSSRISTDRQKTADEYAISILNSLALYGIDKSSIKGAIVSSVVPPVNSAMREAIRLVFKVDALFVGPGVKSGISIQCDIPSSVGADLIAEAVAGSRIYGCPCLIIDIDTVTKFTFVDKKGAFVGASIMPGVLMGLNALAEGTAQLPKISLEAPGPVLGKNTADCMRSGAIYGNASMVDGMIDRVIEEQGLSPYICVTGEASTLVVPYCNHKMQLDEHLVLKGLNFIYRKNNPVD